jgi:hypothetical protein
VDRGVGRLGQLLVGGGGEEDVGGLAADLELVEVVVLQEPDMVEAGFDHRLGAGLGVFLQQVLSRLPALTPMRMEQPWSLAARTTSRTRSAEPMLPGLMRRQAAPASAASMARR